MVELMTIIINPQILFLTPNLDSTIGNKQADIRNLCISPQSALWNPKKCNPLSTIIMFEYSVPHLRI